MDVSPVTHRKKKFSGFTPELIQNAVSALAFLACVVAKKAKQAAVNPKPVTQLESMLGSVHQRCMTPSWIS